ncbi:hypothetical protein SAMN04488540_11012 [Ferrimonas sediminum]|uniref:Uncharacterized protein n=1 Tax=Ferrimonas sediminum TaxID=718193 RepID=A0A1G8UVL0_9GAMM|nr:hypothetical protein [Ferrimonas sediminum]SDJ57823.1 hypothetical protein SAMN04488540_11012 [Ferrimonas sediminum]
MYNDLDTELAQGSELLPDDPLLFYDHLPEELLEAVELCVVPHLYTLNQLFETTSNPGYLLEADRLAGQFSLYLPRPLQINLRRVTTQLIEGKEVGGMTLKTGLRKQATKDLDVEVMLFAVWDLVEEHGCTILEACAQVCQQFKAHCRRNNWQYSAKALAQEFSRRRESIGQQLTLVKAGLSGMPESVKLSATEDFSQQFPSIDEVEDQYKQELPLNRTIKR